MITLSGEQVLQGSFAWSNKNQESNVTQKQKLPVHEIEMNRPRVPRISCRVVRSCGFDTQQVVAALWKPAYRAHAYCDRLAALISNFLLRSLGDRTARLFLPSRDVASFSSSWTQTCSLDSRQDGAPRNKSLLISEQSKGELREMLGTSAFRPDLLYLYKLNRCRPQTFWVTHPPFPLSIYYGYCQPAAVSAPSTWLDAMVSYLNNKSHIF